ncbi:MAG: RagB/SusD family nutrient uptake outer membrane protein [Bacteroidales bacterium]|nr:RagB/SusD family nutrient uptake outer membrane protein [Bacteroidales bacterium]
MKAYKIFFLILMVAFVSCEEFLEEEYKGGVATETWYTTVDGMEGLVAASYTTAKIWYGKEEGFDFSVPGTDIYDYGQQHPQQYQYTYTTDFNPTNSRLVVLWVEYYKGINACNDAIDVLSDPDRTPFDEERTKTRLSEVRFLRALYNWLLVETWGGVELRKEPIKGVVKTASRSSVDDFYTLILEDLDFAVANLTDDANTEDTDYGRITKLAAQGFRARMRLTRASYTNDAALYAAAAEDAAAVINSGKFQLYDDYADVWDIANDEKNTESIWAINYSRSAYAIMGVDRDEYREFQRPADKPWDEREGGHHGHLMFGMQYDVFPGMTRDIENGRPFRRYSPTKYLIDAFHEDIDERFYGSFKTTWFCNNELTAKYVWPVEGFHEELAGEPLFGIGDTSIFLTKETFPDNLMIGTLATNYWFNPERGFWCLDYKRMFNEDGTINDEGAYNRNLFFELNKFYDNTRPAATDAGSMNGIRDAMVMRISEMYLIAAEGLWRAGQADNAYTNYLVPLANKRSYTGDGAAMLASYGINGGSDLTMDYFLDERARELCGEQMRWFDLKRLGTDAMVARIKQYAGNQTARDNFSAKFTLRPIPQAQIDALQDKESFPQNPGY